MVENKNIAKPKKKEANMEHIEALKRKWCAGFDVWLPRKPANTVITPVAETPITQCATDTPAAWFVLSMEDNISGALVVWDASLVVACIENEVGVLASMVVACLENVAVLSASWWLEATHGTSLSAARTLNLVKWNNDWLIYTRVRIWERWSTENREEIKLSITCNTWHPFEGGGILSTDVSTGDWAETCAWRLSSTWITVCSGVLLVAWLGSFCRMINGRKIHKISDF